MAYPLPAWPVCEHSNESYPQVASRWWPQSRLFHPDQSYEDGPVWAGPRAPLCRIQHIASAKDRLSVPSLTPFLIWPYYSHLQQQPIRCQPCGLISAAYLDSSSICAMSPCLHRIFLFFVLFPLCFYQRMIRTFIQAISETRH
jgi:hypothetical protein